ncbi:metal ABC transporter permease [Candidatus Uhrbacteria bacterium]|nr:metal ABC transporter permease [Candidatus Uhrbacteria bacterium]
MFDLLQYSFIVRGLEAGVIVALIAPLIGIFLVLRRYALIADTLAHVSLAGVAIGLMLNIHPLVTALGASAVSAVVIEYLRVTKKLYGETALSLFLSGSLAVAVVLIGLAHGFNTDLFSYLFGSIVTVKQHDIYLMVGIALSAGAVLAIFFKEFFAISFDEEAAHVSGIPVRFLNTILVLLAAVVIAIAIPIVGILLISALLIIPVITALQFKKSFLITILLAELFSVVSVIAGIIVSFYLNLSSGGVIVLLLLAFFIIALALRKKKENVPYASLF